VDIKGVNITLDYFDGLVTNWTNTFGPLVNPLADVAWAVLDSHTGTFAFG